MNQCQLQIENLTLDCVQMILFSFFVVAVAIIVVCCCCCLLLLLLYDDEWHNMTNCVNLYYKNSCIILPKSPSEILCNLSMPTKSSLPSKLRKIRQHFKIFLKVLLFELHSRLRWLGLCGFCVMYNILRKTKIFNTWN